MPFRLLCRRHGAELVYTEMLFSETFVEDEAYRREMMQSSSEDHPLVVQFCGNKPETLGRAAQLAEQLGADAVDINLGCPLIHAKNNCFGAYLLDREHWPTVASMVTAMREKARQIPVFCKIRLLPDLKDTIELAQVLEQAGCDLLAVHGRWRGEPGDKHKYAADLSSIAAVVEAVSIPVVSNGNTAFPADVSANLRYTGAAGIMSAEGVLRNPALFCSADASQEHEPPKARIGELVKEYLCYFLFWRRA